MSKKKSSHIVGTGLVIRVDQTLIQKNRTHHEIAKIKLSKDASAKLLEAKHFIQEFFIIKTQIRHGEL